MNAYVNINEYFFGTIKFSKNDIEYIFHLINGHYYIEISPKENNMTFDNKVGKTYQFFRNNISEFEIDNNNFMKIKHNPENLLNLLNYYILNEINSYLIFNYIDKYYPDERYRCYVSLGRIHHVIREHNLKPYGFKYDDSSIKEIRCLNPVKNDFPDDIDTLNVTVDKDISIYTIPDTVRTLIIYSSKPDVTVIIPNSVKTLQLRGISYKYKKVEIPTDIRSLILNYEEDLESNLESIAKNISNLNLYHINSNCNINKLNDSLKKLTELKNLDLTFIYKNGNPINLIIPDKIQTLDLFLNIDSTFKVTIPDSVTTLSIKFPMIGKSEIKLDNIIPKTVTNLTLREYKYSLINVIPNQIETLTLYNCDDISSIISKYTELKTLSLTDYNEYRNPIVKSNIPPSVITLIFRYLCPIKLSEIPEHIKNLHIGQYILEEGEDIKFPSTIETLTFGDEFNLLLKPGIIPDSVTELNLGSCNYIDLTEGIIPKSVKKLTFGDDFNKELTSEMIPDSVLELKLPHKYDHDLKDILRPNRKINQEYRSYICDLGLPDNVKKDILEELHKPIC